MKMRTMAVALLAVLPAACGGGGGSTPTPVAAPPVTQPPAPNYSGTYSGAMLFNLVGQAELRITGRVAVTQNGNALDFGNLMTSGGGLSAGSWQLGTATLSGNTFTGTSAYQSAGCGLISVAWNGRFAGNLMNLTALLDPASRAGGCARSEFRGELSR